MSIHIMSNVWKDSKVTEGRELLTLLAMADWADDNGGCFPSYDTLGKKARISERQAIRVVKGLIEKGEVCKPIHTSTLKSNLFVVLTGATTKNEIEERITKSVKARGGTIKPNDLKECVESVMENRKGDKLVMGDTYDTLEGDTYDTPTMTPVSPYTLDIPHIDTSVEATPPPPQKKQPKKLPQHPFIIAYRDEFRRSPNRQQMELLSTMPTSEQSVTVWASTLKEWALKGWNVTNIQGLLEKFNRDWVEQSPQSDKIKTQIININGIPRYQAWKSQRWVTIGKSEYDRLV